MIREGTTTIGLVCKDGVVLATEKRAVTGSFIASRSAKKIYQIDALIGMTTAGIVGDAQVLARAMSVESGLYKVRKGRPMSVKAVSTLLSNILSSQRFFPYFVQILTGGVDKDGAWLYSMDPFGGQICEKEIVATGSGSPIAYGVLEDRYSKDMAIDEAVKLAVRALYSAMKRDSASGGECELVKITEEGYTPVPEEEISKIRKELA